MTSYISHIAGWWFSTKCTNVKSGVLSRMVQRCLSICLLCLVLQERTLLYNGYFRLENNKFISAIQMHVDSHEILCRRALGGDANQPYTTGLDNQIVAVFMHCKYNYCFQSVSESLWFLIWRRQNRYTLLDSVKLII